MNNNPFNFEKDPHSIKKLQQKTSKKTSSTSIALVSMGGLLAALAAFSLFTNQTRPSIGEPADAHAAIQVEESVVATVTAVVAEFEAATATADALACFISPLPQYPNVAVRQSPEVTDTNLIRALYQGDQMRAVGHNGRTLNVDRWWLVEFEVGGELTYGWIHSSVVEEISEQACISLTQVPGS